MHTEACIQTYTGQYFDILNPKVRGVNIVDIAHALSQLCRFTGHTSKFYSVAQHSVTVSRHVPKGMELDGLLHDASEAYMADISRPLKHAPEMSRYRTAEKTLSRVIERRFGLSAEPKEVKHVDRRMCATEMRDLMGSTPYDFGLGVVPFDFIIRGQYPLEAEEEFLERFYELRFERGATRRKSLTSSPVLL